MKIPPISNPNYGKTPLWTHLDSTQIVYESLAVQSSSLLHFEELAAKI
jgi:hypothetical protein